MIIEKNLYSSRFQLEFKFVDSKPNRADSSGRAVYGVGLRPLACWDCGLESDRVHGCLSVVSAVCCQVEVCASGWSLVTRSATDCGVSTGVFIT